MLHVRKAQQKLNTPPRADKMRVDGLRNRHVYASSILIFVNRLDECHFIPRAAGRSSSAIHNSSTRRWKNESINTYPRTIVIVDAVQKYEHQRKNPWI